MIPRAPCSNPLRFLVQVFTLVLLAISVTSSFMFFYYPNDVLKLTARQSCLVPFDGGLPPAVSSEQGGLFCSLMKHSAQAALGARQTVEQVLGGPDTWDTSDAAGPPPLDTEIGYGEDLPPLITTPPPKPELRRDAMNICILSMDTYGVKGMVGSGWRKIYRQSLTLRWQRRGAPQQPIGSLPPLYPITGNPAAAIRSAFAGFQRSFRAMHAGGCARCLRFTELSSFAWIRVWGVARLTRKAVIADVGRSILLQCPMALRLWIGCGGLPTGPSFAAANAISFTLMNGAASRHLCSWHGMIRR